MPPISIRLRGFKGIRTGLGLDEISLDFTNLPKGLIALTGETGKGKTTLLDNLSHFRVMPYKLRESKSWGPDAFSYYDQCYGRDACKEFVSVEDGITYRSVLLIDAERRKQEAYLYRLEAGEWVPYSDAVKDGKAGEFDKAVEEILGSPMLYFSSVFRSQAARRLSSYPRSEILSIVCEMLNIDGIRAQYEKAGKVVAALSQDVESLEVRRLQLAADLGGEEALLDSRVAAERSMAASEMSLVSLRDELAAAKKQIHDLELANAAQAVTQKRVDEMRDRNHGLLSDIARLQGEISAREVEYLAEAEALGAAVSQEQADFARITDGIKAGLANDRLSFNQEIGAIADKKTAVETILTRKDEINVAASREPELDGAIVSTRGKLDASRTAYSLLRVKAAELTSTATELSTVEARMGELRAQKREAEAIVSCRMEIEQAVAREAELLIQAGEAKELVARAVENTTILRAKVVELSAAAGGLKSAEAQLADLRQQTDCLEGLDCFADESGRINESCKLLASAVAAKQKISGVVAEISRLAATAKELKTFNSELSVAETAGKDAADKALRIDSELADVRKLSARQAELSRAIVRVAEIDAQIPALERDAAVLAEKQKEAANITQSLVAAEQDGREIAAELSHLEAELAAVRALTVLLPELDGATARIVELELMETGAITRMEIKIEEAGERITDATVATQTRQKRLADRTRALEGKWRADRSALETKALELSSQSSALCADIERLEATLNGALAEELADLGNTVDQAETDIVTVEANLRLMVAQLGALNSQIAGLSKNRAEISLIVEEIRITNEEIANWRLLAKAFSNDGIIALEIDDAGPAISATANDLLKACYGPRFSVRLETQGQKAGGGLKEIFDITVFDAERDEVKSIRDMSGGEVTYIEDAITRSFGLYNLHRHGRVRDTLFSDETDGGLDEKKKLDFMEIKRRALEVGGHEREFFISHTTELVRRADAVIEFGENGVAVRW